MRSQPDLPPLAALRVFEAVGRLQSFRRAAEELCISQSAVSYHVKTLEQQLATKLFERHARGISFSAAGERYFDTVRQAFDLITGATQALGGSGAARSLRVSVLPSFAAGWLVPRLPKFHAAHPDVALMLDPSLTLARLDQGEADLAIRLGRGDWPDVETLLLAAESLSPVASPALLKRQPVRAPEDVLEHTVLDVSRPTEWALWAGACGVDLSQARRLPLTDYNIALQAAIDGQGVAMGRRLLVAERLKAGLLEQPLAEWITEPGFGYWLCLPKRRPTPELRRFVDWLCAELTSTSA